MERFSQREAVLLGYSSTQRSFMNSSSPPKSDDRSSDVDFRDVFGGPPRRSSMPEARFSFGESNDFRSSKGSFDEQWSRLGEKPVFGDDTLSRRRLTSSDFFSDIFGGDSSLNSTPMRHGRDPFASTPGSRVLSPARPLPPKAEPFGSSSVLAQFSLPAKLSKGVDLPTFGSPPRSPHKSKNSAPNGISHSYSSSSLLSRFSSHAIQGTEGSRPSYPVSPLSQEMSVTSEVASNLMKSDKTESGGKLKKDSESSEKSTSAGNFHFSIYKWASKGVPLEMPLRGRTSSKSKKIVKSEPLSASSGWIDNDITARNSSEIPVSSSNGHTLPPDKIIPEKMKRGKTAEEAIVPVSESEEPSSLPIGIKDDPANTLFCHALPEKLGKEIFVTTEEVYKPEVKPLCSLLFDNDLEKGSDEIAKTSGKKESIDNSTRNSSLDVGGSKNTSSKNSEVDKVYLQSSPRNSRENDGRNTVKGRVKDFVKMFNKEAPSKPKDGVKFRSAGYKMRENYSSKDEANMSTLRTDIMPDAFTMINEEMKQSKKEYASVKNTGYEFSNTSGKDNPASNTDLEETEESFQESFQMKELLQDENETLGSGTNHDEIQAIDVKIRQWTKGKEGNIRSLLSNLQYVLWPQSGWKPVPLVDIIEGNAVKRTYQKALLCLHPDKLQQKGAALHQKYTAEKVFDILQFFFFFFFFCIKSL
ncbi:hypothetical protein UlMin_034298 [Ulmus minor]